MTWTIRVLDQTGNWYDNAYIENDFDAIQVAKFYKEQLGYSVQLLKQGKDMTNFLDSTKIVKICRT